MNLPVISGNLELSRSEELRRKVGRKAVFDIGGQKVGIVSALAVDTPETSSPGPNVIFQSDIDSLKAEVADLQAQGITKIVALTHVGFPEDKRIAAEVPGIDAIIVGPYDFTMSMKKPGQFHDPEVMAAFDDCCRKIRAKGLMLGCYTECDFDLWKKRGVQFMAVKNDTNAMMLGFHEMLARARADLRGLKCFCIIFNCFFSFSA